MIGVLILQVVRALVIGAFAFASLVGLTHWAVHTGRLQPFGRFPLLLRRLSDPLLQPLERRLVRAGGNPQDTPLWFVGVTVVGGLVLISGTTWLIGAVQGLVNAAQTGPRGLIRLLVNGGFTLLWVALVIRVMASWFGISPYSRWMRYVLLLTDWLVGPIRRVMPPFGMIDLSPLVACLALWVAQLFLISFL